MHDLPFKHARTIVEDAANDLRRLVGAVREKQFNPRLAREMGDQRTDAEREHAFLTTRDEAADALAQAEEVLRQYLQRRR